MWPPSTLCSNLRSCPQRISARTRRCTCYARKASESHWNFAKPRKPNRLCQFQFRIRLLEHAYHLDLVCDTQIDVKRQLRLIWPFHTFQCQWLSHRTPDCLRKVHKHNLTQFYLQIHLGHQTSLESKQFGTFCLDLSVCTDRDNLQVCHQNWLTLSWRSELCWGNLEPTLRVPTCNRDRCARKLWNCFRPSNRHDQSRTQFSTTQIRAHCLVSTFACTFWCHSIYLKTLHTSRSYQFGTRNLLCTCLHLQWVVCK